MIQLNGTMVLTELAAGVAFHGLSLAIAGKVVGSTALVAGGRASAASETAPEASIAATGSTSTTAHSWVGAVAGKMAGEAAAVAASACTGSAQTQSRAVGLDVSEALAMVALLGCRSVSTLILCIMLLCALANAPGRYSRCDMEGQKSSGIEMTYSRWCGDAGIHWTRGLAACL